MERLLMFVILLLTLLLLISLAAYTYGFEHIIRAIGQVKNAPALSTNVPDIPEALTPVEREWVERVVMAEARGEPYEGKVAVAQVIRDRVGYMGFPETVMGVLTQCNQFAEPYEGEVQKTVKEAVNMVFDECISIFPGKLLYFMNPKKARPKGAQWIRDNAMLRVTIGRHEFYGERKNTMALKSALSAIVDQGQEPPKVECKDCKYSSPGISDDWVRCRYDHIPLQVPPTFACGNGKPKDV
jgi:hypothetical protein